MYKYFISLQWKSFLRSVSFGKSLGLKILLGFFALYFGASLLFLGIGLHPLINELFPGEVPLYVVNKYVLIWLALELVFRFLLQTLPIINIKSFLLTPVPKKSIVHYVLLKSLFSFFNFLPFLVVVPFAVFSYVKGEFQILSLLAWSVSLILLSWTINYVNFLLKRKFSENLKPLFLYLFLALALVALEYFEVFKITELFAEGLVAIINYPVLVLVPGLILFGLYKWNQSWLATKLYLDGSLKQKTKTADENQFGWTRRFGDIAPFLEQDLKLIWRNKRPKSTIFLSLFFLLYGLFMYTQEIYQDTPVMFVLIGVFLTGIFMINFGQFIPSWDSSYYAMIMAQNIPMQKYLASKAGLLSFSIVVMTILTTPYVYFGWEILLMNVVCAIYNVGVNVPVLLYAGSFNRKRIDLEKNPFMNYQGTGAAQWLVALPLFLVPMLIFYPVYKLISNEAGLIVLASIGLLGIFLRDFLMGKIEKAYKKNKYAMIQGYKEVAE